MTALALHPAALSLLDTTTSTATPLALPSRFPGTASPRAATGNGSIYVYAPESKYVWEYDGRGRRTSEMVLDGAVLDVVCAGNAVCVHVASKIVVMRKSGKKWESVLELEVPSGMARMLSEGNSLVLLGGEGWVYDLASGAKTVVDVPEGPCDIAKRKNGLALVVAEGEGVRYIPLSATAGPANTVSVEIAGEIEYMAVCGSRVAVASGSNAVIISADGNTESVSLPGPVDALAWVDDTLAAAVSQMVFVHGPNGLSELPLDAPVLGLLAIPPRVHKSERVLSDSSVPNVSKEKVKANEANKERPKSDKENNNVAAKIPIPVPSDKNTFGKLKPNKVPAKNNMPPPPLPLPKANTKAGHHPANPLERLGGRPLATPSNPMMARPAPTGTGDTLRLRPPSIMEEDGHPSPATTAALSPAPSPTYSAGPGWEAYEEMRREIANLQMDMIRMGRGLKNEIRASVAPLVEELRKSRETIARQEAELERLRRGF